MLANMNDTHRPECLSEKRAEISYAGMYPPPPWSTAIVIQRALIALQGKDALIAKFRNSNVMTRSAKERPRVSSKSC
jgi:hypothetical protein